MSTALDRRVDRCSRTIAEFVGDAYRAVFRLPALRDCAQCRAAYHAGSTMVQVWEYCPVRQWRIEGRLKQSVYHVKDGDGWLGKLGIAGKVVQMRPGGPPVWVADVCAGVRACKVCDDAIG